MQTIFLLASPISNPGAVEVAIGPGAFISAAIFLFVFITISFQLLHETAAALLGAVAVFLVTYILGSYFPNLELLRFEEAMVAKERATEQGVEAQMLSRKGNIRKEIKKAAVDVGATLVVLGRPAGEASTFQTAELKAFAGEIELETGVETQII